jgi:predicted nuclease of predicted toxin-antitoxin system
MRVLFDQGTPKPLGRFLQGHTVSTAAQEGWHQLQNSELLDAAEAAGFDLLITTDKNLRYQQNLRGRKIAIIVLSKQQWPQLRAHVGLVVHAVNAATPSSYTEVKISFESPRPAFIKTALCDLCLPSRQP